MCFFGKDKPRNISSRNTDHQDILGRYYQILVLVIAFVQCITCLALITKQQLRYTALRRNRTTHENRFILQAGATTIMSASTPMNTPVANSIILFMLIPGSARGALEKGKAPHLRE